VARRRRTLQAVLLLVALTTAMVACTSARKQAVPASTSTTADTLPLDTVPSSATDVYNGFEPRRQLRFHPAVGASFQTKVSYTEHTSYATAEVGSGPVAVPPITAEVTTTVDAVDPDGTIRSTFRFASVTIDTSGIDRATADRAQASFQSLVGITGTIAMRSTGMVTAFTTDPPPGLDSIATVWLARLSNSLQQLILAFPTEPVGENAIWKVPVSVDFDGLNSSATYAVTLTHLTTDHIDLELKYSQTAPLGPVPAAGLPDGITAELLAFHIDGVGTQQTDLAQVLPASSTLKASGDILFRLLQGAIDERQDQKIAIEVTAAAG
jgi:hypothetical protein